MPAATLPSQRDQNKQQRSYFRGGSGHEQNTFHEDFSYLEPTTSTEPEVLHKPEQRHFEYY